MRKLAVIGMIAFAACLASAKTPRDDDPKKVPDTTSTLVLLGLTVTGLALAANKLRPAGR